MSSLWTCPKCGRQFVAKNTYHACGQFRLEDHFEGKEPVVRELYDYLLKTLNRFGRVKAYPTKTRIVFQSETQFATAATRKRWLEVTFWLRRHASHPLIRPTEMGVYRDYGHVFRLARREDLDDELVELLQEAYVFGCEPQLRRF